MNSTPPFNCPICDSRLDGNVIAWEPSAQGKVGIQKCATCGLHMTYPRFAEPQGEYLGTTLERWEAKYGAIERGERLHDRHKNYLEETAIIGQYLPNGRLLDVGCNAGWLMGYLQKTGRYDLEGVEPSPILARIARRRLGVTIHQSYLDELTERDNAYDGLMATDVIEHILPEKINEFVSNIHRVLKPNGYVFIKTPNVLFTALKSDLVSRLPEMGKRFMLRGRDVWDAKEHVIHWDSKNLARIFTAHQLESVTFLVPYPVETTNSPLGARIARQMIYQTARRLPSAGGVPSITQDIFFIARKKM